MAAEVETKRIFLWVVPRSCSTAMTKCVTFVDNAVVWMEPYMACHFNETAYNPDCRKGDELAEKMRTELRKAEEEESMKLVRAEMAKKIAKSVNLIDQKSIRYSYVKERLEKPEPGKNFIFVKDQSLAIDEHLEYLPQVPASRQTFLIRHPQEVYVSWKLATAKRFFIDSKQWEVSHLGNILPFIPVSDVFKIHHKLWKHFLNTEDEPVILDAHDLISHPDIILPKYFEKIGIPFKKSYLNWDGNMEVILDKWKGSGDIVLLEAMMKSGFTSKAAESTRFDPPSYPRGTSNPELPVTSELKEYIENSMPFYEEMYAHRLC